MIKSLPKSWINITLQDICYSKDGLRRGPFGSAIKKEFFVPDGYKVYEQSNAIYDDVYRGKYFISESKYNELKAFAVQEGDFLVSCSGTLGKITLVPKGAKAGIINQALLRIRTDSTLVNKSFFQYFFRSEVFQRLIFDQSQGTAMNNLIGIKDFKLLEIPLPPIAEQNRIVAKIEELFSELDKGIETLKTAQQQLKVYRQAVLKYAFEGKLTNPDFKEGELPMGWIERNLASVCEITSSKRIFKDEYVSEGIPFYRTKEVKELSEGKKPAIELYIEKSKYDAIKSRFQVPGKGDVLLSAVGTIGVSYVIRDEKPFYFKDGNLMWFRNLRNIDSYFLSYALTHFIRNGKDASVSGSAYNALTIETMKVFKVAIPEFKEQKLVVQEIESRLSVCDKIEESIEQGLQQAEALRQSILKKAFEGKLVIQDSSDESAYELLQRIKTERAIAQPVKKTKTKKVKA